jgi:hypothetical protein
MRTKKDKVVVPHDVISAENLKSAKPARREKAKQKN